MTGWQAETTLIRHQTISARASRARTHPAGERMRHPRDDSSGAALIRGARRTLVPVLAKGKAITERLWVYVRDDRPFAGPAPPAVIFFYSPDRTGRHPASHFTEYSGILQADAYAGFNDLYLSARKPGPIVEAACWAHGRRKVFELEKVGKAPIAIEAMRRIDAIFDAERAINRLPADQRLATRQRHIAPLVASLESRMRGELGKLSRLADVVKAMNYMLKRWPTFARFVEDGRTCLSNNAAETFVARYRTRAELCPVADYAQFILAKIHETQCRRRFHAPTTWT